MSQGDEILTRLVLLYNAKMTVLRGEKGPRLSKQKRAMEYALRQIETPLGASIGKAYPDEISKPKRKGFFKCL